MDKPHANRFFQDIQNLTIKSARLDSLLIQRALLEEEIEGLQGQIIAITDSIHSNMGKKEERDHY